MNIRKRLQHSSVPQAASQPKYRHKLYLVFKFALTIDTKHMFQIGLHQLCPISKLRSGTKLVSNIITGIKQLRILASISCSSPLH
jgi:hypothetical protein